MNILYIICTTLWLALLFAIWRKDVSAVKKLTEARNIRNLLPCLDRSPKCYRWCKFCDGLIVVYAQYRNIFGNSYTDTWIKSFEYDPKDMEDFELAVRDAEELIETLKRK